MPETVLSESKHAQALVRLLDKCLDFRIVANRFQGHGRAIIASVLHLAGLFGYLVYFCGHQELHVRSERSIVMVEEVLGSNEALDCWKQRLDAVF
jgi:hypothetical protein